MLQVCGRAGNDRVSVRSAGTRLSLPRLTSSSLTASMSRCGPIASLLVVVVVLGLELELELALELELLPTSVSDDMKSALRLRCPGELIPRGEVLYWGWMRSSESEVDEAR